MKDKTKIVSMAANLANKDGFENLKLYSLSDIINVDLTDIATLYNSIDELRYDVAQYACKKLCADLKESIKISDKVEALKSFYEKYLNFALKNPGLYSAIQWRDSECKSDNYMPDDISKILSVLLRHFNLGRRTIEQVLFLIKSTIHGFIMDINLSVFSKNIHSDSYNEWFIEVLLYGLTNTVEGINEYDSSKT